MKGRLRSTIVLAAFVAGLAGSVSGALAQDGRQILVTEVRGPITPVVADHLGDAVAAAEQAGAAALIVELDTPGGLVSSMRSIVQDFLGANVPVVVHVTPSGADAGSAGTFITLAAHVAAMAPATTIGAATPVDLGGGEVGDKVVNNAAAYAQAIAEVRGRDVTFAVESVTKGRSITSTEALEVGAIDLVVRDRTELLAELDGHSVELPAGQVELETAGARIVEYGMTWTRALLQWLADPNLAFVFMSLGTIGIIYEIASPGMGAGGIAGAVFLILALAGLSVLPVNVAGAALVLVGAAMFVVELFVPGFGVAGAGGTVAMLLGGLFLFPEASGLGVDLYVLLPAAIVVLLLVLLAGRAVAVARRRRHVDPADDLIGRTAALVGVDEGRPRVRIDGTWWRVQAAEGESLPAAGTVEVVGRDNIDLYVRAVEDDRAGSDGPNGDRSQGGALAD